MTLQFTELQQQTLRAAVDRLISPDDYPGAWNAGIGDYLAGQFEGEHTFTHSVFNLLRTVDDQRLPSPNFEDGVKSQRVLDAMERFSAVAQVCSQLRFSGASESLRQNELSSI
jgi:hypothetical protein